MRASQYRHRVNLQSASASTGDSYGESTKTWANVATKIPAEVRVVGESESDKGRQVQGHASIVVTMRYRDDVTQESRFLWGTRYLYVAGVMPDVRNRELACNCEERRT